MISFNQYLTEKRTEKEKNSHIKYRKLHINFQGLDVTVENRINSYRTGVDPIGRKWSNKIVFAYGHVKGISDSKTVDVFLGDNKESLRTFTINQLTFKRRFDEHKVMLGFDNEEDALDAYLSGFDKGWDYFSTIVEKSIVDLKTWLNIDPKKRPME